MCLPYVYCMLISFSSLLERRKKAEIIWLTAAPDQTAGWILRQVVNTLREKMQNVNYVHMVIYRLSTRMLAHILVPRVEILCCK